MLYVVIMTLGNINVHIEAMQAILWLQFWVLDLALGVQTFALAAGDHHTCALLNRGGVMCWGMNTDGQLGDGRSANMIRPIAVGKGEEQG